MQSQLHCAHPAAPARHAQMTQHGGGSQLNPWYRRVSRPYLPTNLASCARSGWFWYSSLIFTHAPSLKRPSPALTHCSITCPSSCVWWRKTSACGHVFLVHTPMCCALPRRATSQRECAAITVPRYAECSGAVLAPNHLFNSMASYRNARTHRTCLPPALVV